MKENINMSVKEVADGLVELCRKGDFGGCVERYYSPDIVSTEPFGDPAEVRGLPAIQEKNAWWESNMEVHKGEVFGPFINGDQFTVEFKFDITNKKTNERSIMDEIALYTVKDGKIVAERFFF
jgi:hypothetical protein